MVQIYIY